ncbi:MAG: threonine ammonia-lyase [Campylobacterales bacterium]|nr:threonine ammonia-lyase [Campylobacterales bacterium]
MINLTDILNSHERLKQVVLKTPLALAPKLSKKVDGNVYLKKENLQLTGSFKLRGAFSKISNLTDEELKKGVIAASAGNHAQGVAFSASFYKTPSIIVMPENTPLTKVKGARDLGSTVILKGNNYDEAYAYAKQYSIEKDITFVHPFSDYHVMAGQGTIALEILQELDTIDQIVVPIGGGGLICGIASYIKQVKPSIKVIGVTAVGAPAMNQSFKNKKPIDTLSVRTIADGIAVRDTSPITLDIILSSVDEIVEVEDEEIANAILFLLENQKLVVEGAGAVGVAALLHEKIDAIGKNTVALLSGGNIDVTMLSVIIEKGLLKSYRKMKLSVTLIDKPGSLMHLTEIFRELSANIVQIGYDRTSVNLSFGDANITIAIETKGKEHQEEIKDRLKKNGFAYEVLY